jgi:hypothetical protein
MRYAIIAILIYLGFLLLRAILRNVLKSKDVTENPGGEKRKRRYNLDKVQDAEYTEVKKNGSSKQ